MHSSSLSSSSVSASSSDELSVSHYSPASLLLVGCLYDSPSAWFLSIFYPHKSSAAIIILINSCWFSSHKFVLFYTFGFPTTSCIRLNLFFKVYVLWFFDYLFCIVSLSAYYIICIVASLHNVSLILSRPFSWRLSDKM